MTKRVHLFPSFPSRKPKDKDALTVQPLPEQRPRALTLPLQDTLIEHHQYKFSGIIKQKVLVPQYTSNQEQSALLTRLPPEIRRIIWQFVLGDNRLHIVRNRGRLSAIPCSDTLTLDLSLNIGTCHHKLVQRYMLPSKTVVVYCKGNDPDVAYVDLLSVPKTCRLIYSETIDIIYKENIFDFDRLDTIIAFSRTVIKSRLSLIRVLTLHHTFEMMMYPPVPPPPEEMYLKNPYTVHPHDAETWEEVCKALSELLRLEELYIQLRPPPGDEYFTNYNAYCTFLQLCQIRQPRVFEISVPERIRPVRHTINDAPFTLTYRT